ncbi:MAG: HAMP domain-containing sensor histidine kinase [Desulfobacterales bacterium]
MVTAAAQAWFTPERGAPVKPGKKVAVGGRICYIPSMTRTKWFFHPIVFFVVSIVALVVSYLLYIYWYIDISTGLETMAGRLNLEPGQALKADAWVVVLVLSILVGIILLGIFVIFVYNQKTQQLYRLQDNFINNFTHELKTPVTSLKLFLETFFKHELSREDQRKYLNFMIQDVGRLSDNINRILDLASIEAKNYAGEFVSEDMVQIVETFRESNKHLFPDCDIRIHYPADQKFTYPVNPAFFDMLLMNLLTNAVKYNDAEKPTVNITFSREKGSVRLRFEDNGIGMDKGEVKRIFGKFYQVGRSDDMSAKGSGLGLHLVQNIARIHKGKVVAESRGRGMGSTFTLTLPDAG